MGYRRDVTEGTTIRFYLDGDTEGNNWVAARIENGQLRLTACDAMLIGAIAGNVITVMNGRVTS
jgi:hypothetical protein